ncbi:ABC transporter permease [Fusibacter ferrireducens]|uniref:ABC transporter permease n=1 Tax=Fusibacter ferrireducens TaxID=2785058 RepID=A0ABS0A0F1_9FIRM|nr:ABC transporter permease [Fusibacter ferrireducens]MBF4695913.1 ABC transporter permease [Fusibacter ferrireducens]
MKVSTEHKAENKICDSLDVLNCVNGIGKDTKSIQGAKVKNAYGPHIRIILSSALLQMKQSFGRSMFKFCMLAYPLFYGFTLYMLYKEHSSTDIMAYVMLGSAVSSLWGTISFSSAGDINRERFMGALEVIFNAPSKFYYVMLGKVLGNTVLGIGSMVISILFISLLSGSAFQVIHVGPFIGVTLLGVVSFVAVGMMLSGLLAISRSTTILMNIMDYPIMILCGIAFPIHILPIWTLPFSYMLSPTHFLALARMCVGGIYSKDAFYHHLIWLMGLTILYVLLSLFAYRMIDINARKDATLGVV